MKKIFFAGIMLAAIPFLSFAQTTTTTTAPAPAAAVAAPGLLPTDFFYFLDQWGEAINTFFTFNPIKKAQLHLEYAKERAAEIKAVLADPSAKLNEVAGAKDNFGKQIAAAAGIVKDEKAKGVDVSTLARELDDELDATHVEIKDSLNTHRGLASEAENEIRAKIAALSPGDPQLKGLTQALESITKEKDDATKEKDDLDTEVSDEQSIFEDAMGPQAAAEKHIEQALRLRELRGGEEQDGLGELRGSATSSAEYMRKAQEALGRGDFEAAKEMSKNAEKGFEEGVGESD